MKNISKSFVFFISLFFCFNSSVFSQQWSSEQQEVWAGLQKYWEIDNSNPTAFLKYFDDSYLGWSNDNDAPANKEETEKMFKYYSSKRKVQFNTSFKG